MYSNYGYTDNSILFQAIGGYLVLVLALLVLLIVAEWKIFKKAGKPGWVSLIPYYKTYVQFDIFWGDKRYFWLYLIASLAVMIPVLGIVAGIVTFVMSIMLTYKMSRSFGYDIGFTLGLLFLPNIFTLILAFNSAKYIGAPKKSETEEKFEDKVEGVVKEEFKEPEPQVVDVEAKPVEEPEPVTNVADREPVNNPHL